MSDEIRVVLISYPNKVKTVGGLGARSLARALVAEGLAACVHVGVAGRSIYRWKGEVEEADEHLLVAKTTAARVPALIERVKALHTYELPEIIALPVVDGLPEYLSWVRDEADGKRHDAD